MKRKTETSMRLSDRIRFFVFFVVALPWVVAYTVYVCLTAKDQ